MLQLTPKLSLQLPTSFSSLFRPFPLFRDGWDVVIRGDCVGIVVGDDCVGIVVGGDCVGFVVGVVKVVPWGTGRTTAYRIANPGVMVNSSLSDRCWQHR